jgi:decaprenylphospho-beta-D-erythro-pentofuranosid-2-ulose 2-reductase
VRDATGRVDAVLVIGGGSDLGLACARTLVARGTRTVVLAARRPERLGAAADSLRSAGAQRVRVVPFDADVPDEHEAALDRAWADAEGDVDVVLVAFGLLGAPRLGDGEPEAALALMRTNTLGGASAALRAAARLRRQGHGTLVVISSVAAERPRPATFVYGASKAGLDFLARGLGDALAGSGVRVVVARPGFVRTKMTAGMPAPPGAASAEAVAAAIADAVRDGRSVAYAPRGVRALALVLRALPGAVVRRLPR